MNAFISPNRARLRGVVMFISSRFAGACLAAVLTCCFSVFLSLTAEAAPQPPYPGCVHIILGGPERPDPFRDQGGGHIITDSVGEYWWCPPFASPSLVNPFQPFIGIDVGFGGSNADFKTAPPFSVGGSGFVYGINGGVLFDIPGTPISFGPRVGWLGGNMSGSTANPPASPTFTYSVLTRWAFYEEGMIQWRPGLSILGRTKEPANVVASITRFWMSMGWAETKTKVTGTSGDFRVSDSTTKTGFTAAVGVGVPIVNTPLSITAQFRYINVPTANFNIPGVVPIGGNIYIGTIGLQANLDDLNSYFKNLREYQHRYR